ncbi:MAG: PKD domain-containing protein [Nocardioides sp.]
MGSTRGAFFIGGKVFYGNSDGWLYSRTYHKGAFGPAVKLDPYHDPYWNGVPTGSGTSTYTGVVPDLFGSFNASVSGLAYYNGRLYYSTAGSSTLNYRYFSADSGIVGSEVVNASNGINWSDANIAFSSGDQLYFVSRSTGQLKRIALVNNLPTGSATVVDASRDWRGRSVFLAPQNVNVPPVADFSSSCVELSCDFDASASVDPDGSITDFTWDFGDGSTASSGTATVHHDFAAGGDKSVTLTVTDNEGATGTTTKTVTVVPPADSHIAFVDSATSADSSNVTSASITVPAECRPATPCCSSWAPPPSTRASPAPRAGPRSAPTAR